MKKLAYLLAVVAFLMSCVFTYAAEAEEDLLIYSPFDEGQGNKAEDVGPNGFVGDIKNAKWVEGIAGQADRKSVV